MHRPTNQVLSVDYINLGTEHAGYKEFVNADMCKLALYYRVELSSTACAYRKLDTWDYFPLQGNLQCYEVFYLIVADRRWPVKNECLQVRPWTVPGLILHRQRAGSNTIEKAGGDEERRRIFWNVLVRRQAAYVSDDNA
jgi:hypothetical protein